MSKYIRPPRNEDEVPIWRRDVSIAVNTPTTSTGTITGMAVATNVAAVSALSIPASATAVEMLGYTTVGDGGQGTFAWDSSDLSTEVTADTLSGIYIAPDSAPTGSSGAWVRQFNGAYNVKWFGDSDYAAAVTYASGDSTVYFPPGTYDLSGVVVADDTLYVGSGTASIIQQDADDYLFVFANGNTNIKFQELVFVGNGTSAKGAASIAEINFDTFENNYVWDSCTFKDFGGIALALGGCRHCKIVDCLFINTGTLNNPSGIVSRPAIWCSDNLNPGSYNRSAFIEITGCTFTDLYWSGIYALGDNITISNNYFDNTRESCIFISPSGTLINVVNNIFNKTRVQNISASGVEVGGNYVNVSSNTIYNCELFGISVQNCINTVVADNIVYDCQDGISVINNSVGNECRYLSINNNNISGCDRYGLSVVAYGAAGSVYDSNIENNTVVNSTTRNYYQNTSASLSASNVFGNNNLAMSVPKTEYRNLAAIGTGSKLLTSTSFRPNKFTCNAAMISTTKSCTSQGQCTVGITGSFGQTAIYSCATRAGVAANLISVYDGATPQLVASITSIAYNVSTGLWDTYMNVTTNTGVAIWISCVASYE